MAILGLGTDIVAVARLAKHTPDSPAFAKRVLHPCEFKEYMSHQQPTRYLAKRFALKEAAVKALGTGIGNGVNLADVWCEYTKLGQPWLRYCGGFAKQAEAMGITLGHVSISDEKDYVVATVILTND